MFNVSLDDLVRPLATVPLAYLAVVAMVRVSGKRSLAKLNAFDLVVTVAIGSLLASTVTSSGPGLAAGLVAVGLLLLLQVAVSWVTSRRGEGTTLVRAEPTLVVCRGSLRDDAVRRARLTEAEVLQAVRSGGFGGLDEVAAVCLESDGSLSVVGYSSLGDGWALRGVPGWTPAG